MKQSKGFTLIEMMIVIAIVGIIAAIAIPAIKNRKNVEELGCAMYDAHIVALEKCINDEQCAMSASDYKEYETMKQSRDQCKRKGSTKVKNY